MKRDAGEVESKCTQNCIVRFGQSIDDGMQRVTAYILVNFLFLF